MKTQNPTKVHRNSGILFNPIILFFVSLFLFSCRPDNKPAVASAKIPGEKQAASIVINLQPLGDIPDSYVKYLQNELGKVYGHIRVNKAIPLPSSAWYSPRKRYRADSLIRFLAAHTPEGHVTVGLTIRDISHTNEKSKDFGIMGLGYQPGPSCVVSTVRLSEHNLLPQFFKVTIHEIGHTQGLPHCPEKACFMRDAEGKNRTDEETGFCTGCKSVLEKKGWAFSNSG